MGRVDREQAGLVGAHFPSPEQLSESTCRTLISILEASKRRLEEKEEPKDADTATAQAIAKAIERMKKEVLPLLAKGRQAEAAKIMEDIEKTLPEVKEQEEDDDE